MLHETSIKNILACRSTQVAKRCSKAWIEILIWTVHPSSVIFQIYDRQLNCTRSLWVQVETDRRSYAKFTLPRGFTHLKPFFRPHHRSPGERSMIFCSWLKFQKSTWLPTYAGFFCVFFFKPFSPKKVNTFGVSYVTFKSFLKSLQFDVWCRKLKTFDSSWFWRKKTSQSWLDSREPDVNTKSDWTLAFPKVKKVDCDCTYKHSVVRPKFNFQKPSDSNQISQTRLLSSFATESKMVAGVAKTFIISRFALMGKHYKKCFKRQVEVLFRLFFSSISNFNFRFRKKPESNRLYFLVPKARIGSIFLIESEIISH